MPVSDDFPLSDEELEFLRELVRTESRFLVVGLGAAVLQGADTVTQDLDLWFGSLDDPAIDAAARKVGGAFASRATPPMLLGSGLERLDIVRNCDGLASFEDEYAKAIDVPVADFSIKVLRLERVIASKRAAGRPQDKAVLESLRAALAAHRATRR